MRAKSNGRSSTLCRVIFLLLFVGGLLLAGGCEELPDDPDQNQEQDSGSHATRDSTPPNIEIITFFDDFPGLQFGSVPLGLQAYGYFYVWNKGTGTLLVGTMKFRSTIFRYNTNVGSVPGKGGGEVIVKFMPEEEKSYTDTLTIKSNDPKRPVVTLPVTGRGVSDTGKGWMRLFNGTGWETFHAVRATGDDGYIVAGTMTSSGPFQERAWLLKTDAGGRKEWERTLLTSNQNSQAWSVEPAGDGGYIVAGFIQPSAMDHREKAFLMKTDASGNEEWTRNYTINKAYLTRVYSVQPTTDGGYILVGMINPDYTDKIKILLLKTDSTGQEAWSRTFEQAAFEVGNEGVQQTTDGGYVLAGRWSSFMEEESVGMLLKTDDHGIEEWRSSFGNYLSDYFYSVQQTTDGGYITAGSTMSSGAGNSDAWLVKTNSQGTAEWARTFGGKDEDFGYEARQSADGGFILAGSTRSSGSPGTAAWLIKTDASGQEEWVRTYGGLYTDEFESVRQTVDGGYILAGTASTYAVKGTLNWSQDFKGLLLKTDADGQIH